MENNIFVFVCLLYIFHEEHLLVCVWIKEIGN